MGFKMVDVEGPTTVQSTPATSEGAPWSKLFVGDSWFASARTAVEYGKREMHFIGIVKTNQQGYPKKYIENFMADKPSGTWINLDVTFQGVALTATGYKYNRKRTVCFIMTQGAAPTVAGEPYHA